MEANKYMVSVEFDPCSFFLLTLSHKRSWLCVKISKQITACRGLGIRCFALNLGAVSGIRC